MPPVVYKWPRGAKRELSSRAQINYTHLCDIIAKRKECPKLSAPRIQQVCDEMGIPTKVLDWVYNMTTTNPVFGPLAASGDED